MSSLLRPLTQLAPVVVAMHLALSGIAVGFERVEHEWISSRALCLASTVVDQKNPTSERIRSASFVLDTFNSRLEANASYSEIVALADYVNRPSELIDSAKTGPERRDTAVIRARLTDTVAGLTEILRNPHHFRRASLVEFHTRHEDAINRVARDSSTVDDLHDALTYNAFADHFLQDSLAAGHMVGDVFAKSHMASLRMHDAGNSIGRAFVLSSGWIDTIGLPLLSRLRTSNCFSEDDGHDFLLAVRAWSETKMASTETIPDASAELSEIRFTARGDGRLYSITGGVPGGSEDQAITLILAVARSILDIVETYAGAVAPTPADANTTSIVNRFPNRECVEVDRAENSGRCFFVKPELDKGPFLSGLALGVYLDDPRSSETPLLYWPVVGLTLENQRQRGQTRMQFSTELIWAMPVTKITQPMFKFLTDDPAAYRHYGVDVSVGYSQIFKGSDGDRGRGPDIHVYLRLKNLFTFVAMDVGYRFYSSDVEGLRIGGRLGFGNELVSGYIGISSDQYVKSGGRSSRDESTVIFGITTNLPTSRLPGVTALERLFSKQ